MATNTWTGAVNNNWSNIGNWSLGHIPAAGEDVAVGAGTITFDVARAPVAGTLGAVTNTSGTINFNLNSGSFEIHAVSFTAGTNELLSIYGNAAASVTSSGIITGGTDRCVDFDSTLGTFNHVGPVNGGGADGYGIQHNNSGTVNLSGGDITAGAAAMAVGILAKANSVTNINLTGGYKIVGSATHNASGVYSDVAAGQINISNGSIKGGAGHVLSAGVRSEVTAPTLTNCDLDFTGGSMPVFGKPPTIVPTAANLHTWNSAKKLAILVTATNLKSGVVNGDVTGTYAGSGMMP